METYQNSDNRSAKPKQTDRIDLEEPTNPSSRLDERDHGSSNEYSFEKMGLLTWRLKIQTRFKTDRNWGMVTILRVIKILSVVQECSMMWRIFQFEKKLPETSGRFLPLVGIRIQLWICKKYNRSEVFIMIQNLTIIILTWPCKSEAWRKPFTLVNRQQWDVTAGRAFGAKLLPTKFRERKVKIPQNVKEQAIVWIIFDHSLAGKGVV